MLVTYKTLHKILNSSSYGSLLKGFFTRTTDSFTSPTRCLSEVYLELLVARFFSPKTSLWSNGCSVIRVSTTWRPNSGTSISRKAKPSPNQVNRPNDPNPATTTAPPKTTARSWSPAPPLSPTRALRTSRRNTPRSLDMTCTAPWDAASCRWRRRFCSASRPWP